MMKAYLAAAAATVIAVGAVPAAAVTLISNQTGAPDPGVPSGFTTVIDFDSPLPAGISNITAGSVLQPLGSVSGAASPAGTTTRYQAVQANSESVFDFTSYLVNQGSVNNVLTGFSLYWGSIDTYNSLNFGRMTGSGFVSAGLPFSFTGGDFPPANGSQPANVTNRRITFGFDRADGINAVQFLSGANAFEFDTLAITNTVPEPASWAMLIAGFGLIGATMRRRRQKPASVLA